MVTLHGVHADFYMALRPERRELIDDWLILHGLFGPRIFVQAILGYDRNTNEAVLVVIDKNDGRRWIERITPTTGPPPLPEGRYVW